MVLSLTRLAPPMQNVVSPSAWTVLAEMSDSLQIQPKGVHISTDILQFQIKPPVISSIFVWMVCQIQSHAPMGWYLTLRRDNAHIQTRLTGNTCQGMMSGVSNNLLCQGRAAPPEICLGSDVQRKILVHRGTHVIQILKVSFPIVFIYTNWLNNKTTKRQWNPSYLPSFQIANFSTSVSRARPEGMDAALEMSLTLCLCHVRGKYLTNKLPK